MTFGPYLLSPMAQASVDVNWVIAIATIAATIGTIFGVLIALWQTRRAGVIRQREELDKQVAKEVEAKIGSVLISLRTLEREARDHLTSLVSQLEQKQQELTSDIEERERTLKEVAERSSNQAQEIEELLQRASGLLPAISSAELIPLQLYIEAGKSQDPAKMTGLLHMIHEHPDSDPRTLELAGDMARQRLNNRHLAEKLYQRGFEMDPENIPCKAEYLHLMAYHPSSRSEARQEIVDLARAHPNHATVINNLLNFFIATDDYKGMIEVAMQLLDYSDEKSMLWRNIAVARSELGYSHQDITEAYETALLEGDEGDYINAARPYVRYLLDRGTLDEAEKVLNQALRYGPSVADLHRLKGDLHRKRMEYEKARESYEWLARTGDQEDQYIAHRRIDDLEILQKLDL